MSEAKSKVALPVNPESDPLALEEALQILRRLASLTESKIDLDDVMTSEQAAAWLKVSAKSLNEDAKANRVPAIPFRNQWRFHPRTILDEAHRRFNKNK